MYTREGWKRELEWKPKLQLSVIKEIYESAYRAITALTARTMHACMQLYRKINPCQVEERYTAPGHFR